ncbi:MAG: AMP-binding protein [Spirochaetaceae bacterium]|nr:AMP-binding protein [Myxococcales bacterium]MCB9722686.1 AMP-binding protein [Spirochaetaceae bacterium]
MLLDLARERPKALAVDDGDRRLDYAGLLDRSHRVADFLRHEVGLAPGGHVALLMGNRAEVIELLLGAVLAGQWVTPINWHLADEEIEYVLADSGARVVFTDDRHAPVLERIGARGAGPRAVRAGAELDGLLDAIRLRPLDLDTPAGGNMIYTSGTTGRPKGVKRAAPPTVRDALVGHTKSGHAARLDGRGPHLITGPMYHAAPLMFAVYDNANGAPIVIMPRWDEREALELIAGREVAHVHLVPTMFVRLLRLPDAERAAFRAPSLRMALHGAAPISVAVKRRMIEWWGPVLVEYWGATEGGVNTLIDSEDWLAHPGSVGRALPAFEIFAVDETGRRLGPGGTGDLYCRSKVSDRPFEYHGDPEKTERAYLEPGVFTIGDIGSVDEQGYVHLADRRSNMIISGGVNIYPQEIEQVLAEHPAVADVAVFGIPDDEWGESVKAAVELREGRQPSDALAQEILRHARAHLAGYKVPRSIDFEAELPRHPSGKLYVRRLRERYWAGRERSI